MSKLFLASATVLVFALGAAGVQANQNGPDMTSDDHGHHGQAELANEAGQPGMMAGGMMGSGMMSSGMMLVMMDADSDGSVSADEFQALHARMFEHLDANGDGKLEAAELGASTKPTSRNF